MEKSNDNTVGKTKTSQMNIKFYDIYFIFVYSSRQDYYSIGIM